jgi:hypothetical protein
VIPQKRGDVRIAIAGRYLDEVQIQQARRDVPGSVSYLSFPAHRHLARVEEDRVTVLTQAATVVTLFADRVLPPIGGRAVTLKIGSLELGPCLLETIETGDTSPLDNTIVLHFRRTDEGSL